MTAINTIFFHEYEDPLAPMRAIDYHSPKAREV
jgi:hypothetical protein